MPLIAAPAAHPPSMPQTSLAARRQEDGSAWCDDLGLVAVSREPLFQFYTGRV